MNILFLTLVKFNSINDRGLYTDLLRKFRDEGHQVSVVCPTERREKQSTSLTKEESTSILKVKTFNIQKTNVFEKGIATLLIEYQYLSAIKKYFSETKFDLILYSTPPITFSKVITYIKKRDNAYSYLLLKDIFPQNAIDMKMMKEKGFLHKMFLKKEKYLYQISDTIGCMSPANVDFVLNHNPEIPKSKVEVNPNSIEPIAFVQTQEERVKIRLQYQLPLDKKILIYGGNLGIPQGVEFLLKTMETCSSEDVFFLIVGSGTQYSLIQKWFQVNKPTNAKLVSGLPKNEYDALLQACDVGLLFLNKNFTIPNFPSRLLSYLEMKIPVIAATDKATDVGKVIEKNKCGFAAYSGDSKEMNQKIIQMVLQSPEEFNMMRENAYKLLLDSYTVTHSYNLIVEKL